jgi:hypothetical protein
MCQIADYLADQRDLVRIEITWHDMIMRRHREALRVSAIEDFAHSMVGKAAFLGKIDRDITRAVLEDPAIDRSKADEAWRNLARDVLDELQRALRDLDDVQGQGYDVQDARACVVKSIDCLRRALLPAEESFKSLRNVAEQVVDDDDAGLCPPIQDGDTW